MRLRRQMLLCDLASGRVDPDELSAARNDTLARRSSGGAAPRLGLPMLLPARGEHVANVFLVRSLAWLPARCSQLLLWGSLPLARGVAVGSKRH